MALYLVSRDNASSRPGTAVAYCRRDIVDAIRYLTHNGPVWGAAC